MAVDGIDHMYLPTTNWGKSVAFWTELGFTLEDVSGESGTLRPAGGGPYLYLEEVPEGTRLDPEIYFRVSEGFAPGPPVEVVTSFTPTHWGTRVMDVEDVDGRVFHLEHRSAAGEPEA